MKPTIPKGWCRLKRPPPVRIGDKLWEHDKWTKIVCVGDGKIYEDEIIIRRIRRSPLKAKQRKIRGWVSPKESFKPFGLFFVKRKACHHEWKPVRAVLIICESKTRRKK